MKLSVLHIIEGLDKSLGGLPYALSNIINMEVKLGFKSTILSLEDNSKSIDSKTFEGIDIFLFQMSFPTRFRNSQKLVDWCVDNLFSFDLVVFHSVWSVMHLRIANIARKKNIPYIVWPHGSLDPFDLQKKNTAKKIIGKLFMKTFLQGTSKICCTSKREIQELETYGAIVSTYELALPVISNKEFKIEDVRSDLKLIFESDKKKILFLSRINYKKGLEHIIKAVNIFVEKGYSDIIIVVAGEGDKLYLDKIRSLISFYNLEENFIFTGHITDNDKIYAFEKSDIFILPSKNENFGIVVVESLIHGLPVIITKNVYIWENIISKNAGWIVEENEASIFNVLLNALTDQAYLEKRIYATKAAEQYSFEHLTDKYSFFYERYAK